MGWWASTATSTRDLPLGRSGSKTARRRRVGRLAAVRGTDCATLHLVLWTRGVREQYVEMSPLPTGRHTACPADRRARPRISVNIFDGRMRNSGMHRASLTQTIVNAQLAKSTSIALPYCLGPWNVMPRAMLVIRWVVARSPPPVPPRCRPLPFAMSVRVERSLPDGHYKRVMQWSNVLVARPGPVRPDMPSPGPRRNACETVPWLVRQRQSAVRNTPMLVLSSSRLDVRCGPERRCCSIRSRNWRKRRRNLRRAP